MDNIRINISEFTENPGPRYIKQDQEGHRSSGEAFYIYKLNNAFSQALREDKRLVLYLDGVSGYPSSFLDEAIGELVYDFTAKEVKDRLLFETSMYKRRVSQVMEQTLPQWEVRRMNNDHVVHSQNLNVDINYLGPSGELKSRRL
ncbi:MAG: STAS-like domain-containing protein [Muribaculaceae bacterium]|nr:STAS-like domain-containing protein [Muribaculaceae bacterium]